MFTGAKLQSRKMISQVDTSASLRKSAIALQVFNAVLPPPEKVRLADVAGPRSVNDEARLPLINPFYDRRIRATLPAPIRHHCTSFCSNADVKLLLPAELHNTSLAAARMRGVRPAKIRLILAPNTDFSCKS